MLVVQYHVHIELPINVSLEQLSDRPHYGDVVGCQHVQMERLSDVKVPNHAVLSA